MKTNTWVGIDLLKRAIPELRLIFLQRDPRSTALSQAKVEARRRREIARHPEHARSLAEGLEHDRAELDRRHIGHREVHVVAQIGHLPIEGR